jgi:hypothetical protein
MTIVVPVILIALPIALIGTLFFKLLGHGRKGRAVLDAIARDPAGGRATLDRIYPASVEAGPLSTLSRRQRLAGLALLGEATSIQEEMARLEGQEHLVASAQAIGWLGLALLGSVDAKVAAARTQALAHGVDPKFAVFARQIALTGALALALSGEAVEGASRTRLASVYGDGPLTEELGRRAIDRAAPVLAA